MDNFLPLLLLLFMNNGNCDNNNNNRAENRERREGGREPFNEEVREEFRRLGLDDTPFTTPFLASRRQICDLEILTFLLVFFLFREINAPLPVVPIPTAAPAANEPERPNPFFERFE